VEAYGGGDGVSGLMNFVQGLFAGGAGSGPKLRPFDQSVPRP